MTRNPAETSRSDGVAAAPTPSTSTSHSVSFWQIPAGNEDGFDAKEWLRSWLDAGFWGLRESAHHRTRLKAGDLCCFYAAGSVEVVARAVIDGQSIHVVNEREWPGPGPFAEMYKVPLREIKWLPRPTPLSRALRADLDAFSDKELDGIWSWFVQKVCSLTAHDFQLLVGGEPLPT